MRKRSEVSKGPGITKAKNEPSASEVLAERVAISTEGGTSEKEARRIAIREIGVTDADIERAKLLVTCPACSMAVSILALTDRPGGGHECGECGAMIDLPPAQAAKALMMRGRLAEAESEDDERAYQFDSQRPPRGAGLPLDLPRMTPTGAPRETLRARTIYCSECSTVLSVTHGQGGSGPITWFPCGHEKIATAVDDPSKAKRVAPAAGTQIVKIPEIEKRADVPPAIAQVSRGQSLRIEWGECIFPVAQFSTFRIGPFTASRELADTDDMIEASRVMRTQLQQIAEEDFETKMRWYKQKLGIAKG